MIRSFKKYRNRIRQLGFPSFVKYFWHQKTGLPGRDHFKLTSRKSRYPLVCRARTTDIDVFKHIYVVGEYDCLETLQDPQLIIDCGANAGFSTSYFLNRFPDVAVIAIEPDPGNFGMLLRNTAPFGDRSQCHQAGIWDKSCGLILCDSPQGDGREWARTVREAGAGEIPDVKALGIRELLDLSGKPRISLLKIDIEGSELPLFSGDCSSWLPYVDHIIIELHGPECTRKYLETVGAAGFTSVVVGGLTWSSNTTSARIPPSP
jgi:FkbM family methyltransferase